MLTLGIHTALITPPKIQGLSMDGMGRLQHADRVLDDLELNLLILQGGGKTAVICITDELFITDPEYVGFQAVLEKRVPGAALILCATHDHSATPVPFGAATSETTGYIEAARQKVRDAFATSLEAVLRDMTPIEVAAARIPFPSSPSLNRRAKLSNGSSVSAFGAGPLLPPGHKCAGRSGADPQEIDLLAFREPGCSHPKVLLTGYSSHIHFYENSCFNTEAAGAARHALRAKLPHTHPLYSVSFAGDIAIQACHPIPYDEEPSRIKWFQESALVYGSAFAEAVIRGLSGLGYESTDVLRFVRHEEAGPSNQEFLLVETLRIGSHALCSLPGEMSLAWEEALRENLPCATLLSMAYNRGWLGYVAPPLAFEEGSYETMRGPSDFLGYPLPTSRAKSATTTGDRIIAIAKQQIHSLYP